jgi:hypothetical protein
MKAAAKSDKKKDAKGRAQLMAFDVNLTDARR